MQDVPTNIVNDPFVGNGSGFGNAPEVDEASMQASNRVVTSTPQAVSMTEQDIQDAKKLVVAARRITAKKQGAPPYNPQTLKNQGKQWKRNLSTRFLQKELNRAAPPAIHADSGG